VWEEIKNYIKNPTLIKQAVQENYRQDQNKVTSLKRELVKIASKLERLELEDEKVLRLYRKNIITENQVHSQIQEIKTEKQILDQQKQELKLKINNQKYLETRLNALEKLTKKVRNNIENLNLERKKEIIDLLIDKIFIKEDGKVELQIIIPNLCQNVLQQR